MYHLVILYSCFFFFFLKSISKKPGLHLTISSCVSASLCQAFPAGPGPGPGLGLGLGSGFIFFFFFF